MVGGTVTGATCARTNKRERRIEAAARAGPSRRAEPSGRAVGATRREEHEATKTRMRLEQIDIQNYGLFKDVTLAGLPRLVVVIGANGTGKSTLFDVFSFLKGRAHSQVFHTNYFDSDMKVDEHGFMNLIAHPNHPKGTMACPCGNGQLLRHCHGAFIARVRGMVDYRHAIRDLDRVQNGWQREQEAAT